MATLIRLAQPEDFRQVAAIYAPYVLNTAISFENDPPEPSEMGNRITKTLEYMPWLVCDRGGQILGYAYGDRFRVRPAYQWSASVSIYVDSKTHRRGVGRALYTSLFEILKLQGIHNLYAGITLPDVGGSVGFHRSFGFTQIGLEESVGYKLGAWHHVSRWHLRISPLVSNPEPPISVSEAACSPSWEAAISVGRKLLER
jgi:L-amino acid N-acyltransferase YncA